jgi:SNARE protein
LAALEAEIRKGTKALAKLKGEKREEKVRFLQGRIKHMRVIHRTYKVELRELSKEEKKPYEQKYHEHEETITRLVQDLDWAKADGDRAELGTKDGAAPAEKGEMTRDQMLDKADKLQKEDLNAVERMKTKVADAQQIGASTNEALHGQIEQLAKTTETLDEQKVLLDQASQQLKAFTRRIATDKIILGFICLVVVLVVVLIVLNIVAPETVADAIQIPSGLDVPADLKTAIQFTVPRLADFFSTTTTLATNSTMAATTSAAAAVTTTTTTTAAAGTSAPASM